MFEDMTYENILEDALSKVETDIDKRQGSVIFDALAPACAEIAQIYVKLENMLNSTFADTASREYLILRAKEIGIEPYSATYSICKGVFNTNVPIGSRFNIDKINFVVTEKISDKQYKLKCETSGTEGNNHIGTLIPIDYISNLTSASLTEVLIAGENEEDTESFRQRYFDEVKSTALNGNKGSYKAWVNAIEGVGMAKAERSGTGGKVNVYVTTPDLTTPSSELLNTIKEKLDPKAQEGLGAGLAPIGHIVTVMGAKTTNLTISVTLTLKVGYTKEGIKPTILAILNSYIEKVNQKWENESITIYSAQLLVEILNISAIENITSLTINSGSYIMAPSNSLVAISQLEVK